MEALGRRCTRPRTWVVLAAAGPVAGAFAGIVYTLAITVPQWVLYPSSAGGTGSAGLSTLGAIIGALVGGVLGTVVGFVAAIVFAILNEVTRRDPVALLFAAAAAACCAFVLFGALGEWQNSRVVWEAAGMGLSCFLMFGLIGIMSAERIVKAWRAFKWRRVNPYGSEQDESQS